jgi:hypothetical protein
MFRLAMVTAQQDGRSDDLTTRSHAKSEADLAQLNRKTAIEKANADAKTALAALSKPAGS